MTDTTTYGVIGATGKTGRRVADRLEAERRTVRRLARGTQPAFDWSEPDAWPAALAGLDRLYVAFVPDLAAPGSSDAIAHLAEVARAAGVQRIVLLSGRGEDGARAAEDVLLASGVDSTIVRASWFSQNFTEGMLADSVAAGFVAIPAGERLEPFVDADDIADVAVEALTGEGHQGRVFEVTGPELLGFADVAALLTELRGHPVAYVPVTLDEFHAAIEAEEGPEAAELLTELCREVFDGRNESLTHGVREALGREPRSLREVLVAASAQVHA
jgi:uncharacterized protein YbjT (DUF2867 family)